MEKMKLIILKYKVVSYRKDNKIVYFSSFLFCHYIVSCVAKFNKFTSPNNKPNHHIPNGLNLTSICL